VRTSTSSASLDHDCSCATSPTGITHRARRELAALVEPTRAYGGSSSELARRHGERLAPVRADPGTSSPGSAHSSVYPGRCANRRVARDRLRRSSQNKPTNQGPRQRHRRSVDGRTGGPLSRAVVRTYGLVLLGRLAPRLRRPALTLFVIGNRLGWRHQRLHLEDVPARARRRRRVRFGVFQARAVPARSWP